MINKNWVSWCWQLGIFGAMIAGAIASCFDCALAQSKIVPDGTLGSERSRVLPNDNGFPIEEIRGGAIRGSNLFHSFLEFNVSVGRGAYFYSPNVEIQNIQARALSLLLKIATSSLLLPKVGVATSLLTPALSSAIHSIVRLRQRLKKLLLPNSITMVVWMLTPVVRCLVETLPECPIPALSKTASLSYPKISSITTS